MSSSLQQLKKNNQIHYENSTHILSSSNSSLEDNQPLWLTSSNQIKQCRLLEQNVLLQNNNVINKEKENSKNENSIVFGDLPIQYKLPKLKLHEIPVIGAYIDPKIVAGYKYKIRTIKNSKELFAGNAMYLKSIGRGFAKRLLFEPKPDLNYFWTDSDSGGYFFQLEVVSIGDKFTIYSVNNIVLGTLEIIALLARVELYDYTKLFTIESNGIASSCRSLTQFEFAKTTVINKVNLGKKLKDVYLRPGIEKNLRRISIYDYSFLTNIIKYTITGIEPYELPVKGTFIHPDIITGFYYRVRVAGTKNRFFNGNSLLLSNIGMGYAKRLTFTPDNLLKPKNYFWTDSYVNGFGFELQVVRVGMKFILRNDTKLLGLASVFRSDFPQMQHLQETYKNSDGHKIIQKQVHIDVLCHVTFYEQKNYLSEEHLMRVYGLAIVEKHSNKCKAKIKRIENIALNSQINMVFNENNEDIYFYPISQ